MASELMGLGQVRYRFLPCVCFLTLAEYADARL